MRTSYPCEIRCRLSSGGYEGLSAVRRNEVGGGGLRPPLEALYREVRRAWMPVSGYCWVGAIQNLVSLDEFHRRSFALQKWEPQSGSNPHSCSYRISEPGARFQNDFCVPSLRKLVIRCLLLLPYYQQEIYLIFYSSG